MYIYYILYIILNICTYIMYLYYLYIMFVLNYVYKTSIYNVYMTLHLYESQFNS